MTADSPPNEARLRAVISETLESTDWTLTETTDGYRIEHLNRAITINSHDGPDETSHWVLTLCADGETVSKFGPYATGELLVEQLATVLESDTLYTVCCDGSPK